MEYSSSTTKIDFDSLDSRATFLASRVSIATFVHDQTNHFLDVGKLCAFGIVDYALVVRP